MGGRRGGDRGGGLTSFVGAVVARVRVGVFEEEGPEKGAGEDGVRVGLSVLVLVYCWHVDNLHADKLHAKN